MIRLGVNIDHIATLREARKDKEPEPALAALLCEIAGADSIVAHLREDRRHIKERDLYLLKELIKTRLNLEMSIQTEIVNIACKIRPDQATLVPEKRQELTTEGGLDAAANLNKISRVCEKLKNKGILVSLFIDPDKKQIDAAKKIGVDAIELHTGKYADAKNKKEQEGYLEDLRSAIDYAIENNLHAFAGHGLNYYNVTPIAKIEGIEELNIGYSIICRSVIVGIQQAVKEMKKIIR